MSKLAKILTATQGHRVAFIDPVSVLSASQETTQCAYGYEYEYTIGAEFKVHTQCREEQLPQTRVRAKRHIIEGVFGEFRTPIQRVYRTLFDRDIEGAMTALRALEDQMFGDTE